MSDKGTNASTHMAREIAEIPVAMTRLIAQSADQIASAAAQMRARDPRLLVSIARGSSDHAAAFVKTAFELTSGLPVASLAPSTASVYEKTLKLGDAVSLSISQSGASPDLIAATRMAAQGGALTVAITNQPQSPLAKAAKQPIDMAAGPEQSVAATKSFVNSIGAGLLLLARFTGDQALEQALKALPDHLSDALQKDWSALGQAIDGAPSFYVLGRGPSLAIAAEAALKFKETCGLHAEAFSCAEIMHGPLALVEKDFPLLTLAARDAAEAGCVSASQRLVEEGAHVYITSALQSAAKKLQFVATGHPLTDALALIVPFYVFVEAYARRTGADPDAPPRLRKVTVTK